MTKKTILLVVGVLIALWIIGVIFKIAGAAIHLLVIVAILLVIAGFLKRRFGSRA